MTRASSTADVITRHGRFRAVAFRGAVGVEHIALVAGEPAAVPTPLVRLQSSCLTSTALDVLTCDCARQMDLALKVIADTGVGVVVYLSQEGMGHGLVGKVGQMADAAAGHDVIADLQARGIGVDLRDYGDAAAILSAIVGRRPVRLLTNNPEKLRRAVDAGIEVAERVPLEVEPTPELQDYLRFKKASLGHLLTKV